MTTLRSVITVLALLAGTACFSSASDSGSDPADPGDAGVDVWTPRTQPSGDAGHDARVSPPPRQDAGSPGRDAGRADAASPPDPYCDDPLLDFPPEMGPRCAASTDQCVTDCQSVVDLGDRYACVLACVDADTTEPFRADGYSIGCSECTGYEMWRCFDESGCASERIEFDCCLEANCPDGTDACIDANCSAERDALSWCAPYDCFFLQTDLVARCFERECESGDTRICYSGPAGTEGVGVCVAGVEECAPGGYWDTLSCAGERVPLLDDTCGDGLDNDCDGESDEGCECAYGETRSCYSGPAGSDGVGICHAGTESCLWTGRWSGSCSLQQLPSASETCFNGIDDNCDGTIDEGCVCTPSCAGKTCGSDGCSGTCGSCASGLSCIAGSCRVEPCDPVTNARCGAGQRCTWDGSANVCVAAGTTPVGASCFVDDCVTGATCAGVGGGEDRCRDYCRYDSDCSGGGKCAYELSGSGLGLCSFGCDPLSSPSGCYPGDGCYVITTPRSREAKDCRPRGIGTDGSSCSVPEDCFSGYACMGGECRHLCEVDGAACSRGSCASVSGWWTYGVCAE